MARHARLNLGGDLEARSRSPALRKAASSRAQLELRTYEFGAVAVSTGGLSRPSLFKHDGLLQGEVASG